VAGPGFGVRPDHQVLTGSVGSIFILKKIQNIIVLVKKQKSTGYNRVLPGQPAGSAGSWLFIFFHQLGPVPAPGWPGFKTMLSPAATNIVVWYCKKTQFFTGRIHHKLWLCRMFTKITRSISLLLLVRRNHMNSVAILHCSREQWRHSPMFRPDRVRSKAKNALNRV